MPLIRPFRALRPAPGRAAEVLSPPYDVLSSAEARARAEGKPWSFLHISKPEIDLDPATDPYDKAVYAKAADNLKRMVEAGVLIRDAKPCYYVYRLTWRGHSQTGLAAAASLADYPSRVPPPSEFGRGIGPHPQTPTGGKLPPCGRGDYGPNRFPGPPAAAARPDRLPRNAPVWSSSPRTVRGSA